MNTLTLNVKSDKVYTRHGVPISVTGIAQVRRSYIFTYTHTHTLSRTLSHPKVCDVWDLASALQVKIQGQNKEMLAAACQMFLGKSETEISHIALETLEGHQRAIIAHLTVEVRRQWRHELTTHENG